MCMTANDNISENKSGMKLTVFRHKKYKDIYLILSIGSNPTFGVTKDLEEAMSNYFLHEKFNCWDEFYGALGKATSESEFNPYSSSVTYMDSRIFEIDGYKGELTRNLELNIADFEGLSAGCPKCGKLVSDYRDYDRCHHCGQKLDWWETLNEKTRSISKTTT